MHASGAADIHIGTPSNSHLCTDLLNAGLQSDQGVRAGQAAGKGSLNLHCQ